MLGNNIAVGTDKNSTGAIYVFKGDKYLVLRPNTLNGNKTITLPNETGTLALTSDITALNPVILEGSLDIVNTPDDTSVDTSTFTVTKQGMYLVVFSVGHAGADSMTQAGAHWLASIQNTNNENVYPDSGGRNAIVMPLGKQWDRAIVATQIYNLSKNTYHGHFHNHTGIGTSTAYASRYTVKAYYLFKT